MAALLIAKGSANCTYIHMRAYPHTHTDTYKMRPWQLYCPTKSNGARALELVNSVADIATTLTAVTTAQTTTTIGGNKTNRVWQLFAN